MPVAPSARSDKQEEDQARLEGVLSGVAQYLAKGTNITAERPGMLVNIARVHKHTPYHFHYHHDHDQTSRQDDEGPRPYQAVSVLVPAFSAISTATGNTTASAGYATVLILVMSSTAATSTTANATSITGATTTTATIPELSVGAVATAVLTVKLGTSRGTTLTGTPFTSGQVVQFTLPFEWRSTVPSQSPVQANGSGGRKVTTPTCQFYVPRSAARRINAYGEDMAGRYSRVGCHLVSTTSAQQHAHTRGSQAAPTVGRGTTTCACNHLTSFAVLMDTRIEEDGALNQDVSKAHDAAIELISIVGVGVSVTSLILIIALYTFFANTIPRSQVRDKKILVALSSSMLASMVLFVAGQGDVTDDHESCAVMGMALHFCLLSTFCIMAIEGHHLYRKFVIIWDADNTNIWVLVAAAYAPPALVVGATALSTMDLSHYGARGGVCWLREEAVWFFVGPALLVIACNIVVLGRVVHSIWVTPSGAAATASAYAVQSKRAAKASVIFSVLMGITWLPAQLVHLDATAGQYIFAITGAFSGLWLFVLHCYQDQNLRKAVVKLARGRCNRANAGMLAVSSTKARGSLVVVTGHLVVMTEAEDSTSSSPSTAAAGSIADA